ncbi:MAG: class I SAM-dependent methyltransferase [Mycobacteriales bacterium]|nr:class I SAM-dependent methyltransferase [Mycobacteriales bacterium]
MTQPGSPTAFEAVVDDYDAARPTYPDKVYDEILGLAGGDVLELGTGTGLATPGLLSRAASVVGSDLGPRMLGRAVTKLGIPAVVARAEALSFADASFDVVTGAQMWHWVSLDTAVPEVLRVLRPGGHLAVWWNEAAATGQAWFDAQEALIEAANPAYRRGYRVRDRGAELVAAGWPGPVTRWATSWERQLDVPLYLRWLRSKSYVQEARDTEALVAAVEAVLVEQFPDGVVTEPFDLTLWVAARS